MRKKSFAIEMNLHPVLTDLLFVLDEMYTKRKQELVITSGSEPSLHHGRTSLHYSGQAVDIRTKNSKQSRNSQGFDIMLVAKRYCRDKGIHDSWIDVVVESDHLHLEYQPKRPI